MRSEDECMQPSRSQGRRGSAVRLDPIGNGHGDDTVRAFVRTDEGTFDVTPIARSLTSLGRSGEPSAEWVAAQQNTTPPPPAAAPSEPPDLLTKSRSPCQPSPSGKKKPSSKGPGQESEGRAARRRTRKVRPCLTVQTSRASTALEVLRVCLEELGWRWKEVCGIRKTPCDLYWHSVSFYDNDGIYSGMVNKFPGLLELVRKAQLSKLLHQMQQLFPDEYDFYPRTWLLPEQYHHFSAEVALMHQRHPQHKPVFIVKPDEGSQGEGIYLITSPQNVGSVGLVRRAVVQEYVTRPLLLERTKFDLRVYVVLASVRPLRLYICKEGMARFCTVRYQAPTSRNLHQVFMHLTNYSLNKRSDTFVHTDCTDRGSKRTLSSTMAALSLRGHNVSALWDGIRSIAVKTIMAMLPDLMVELEAELPAKKPAPSCFQILGLDILVTEDLKPILLEVNANPSLRLDHEVEVSFGVTESQPSPVDEEIKIPLVKDTLRLLRPGKVAQERAKTRLKREKPTLDVSQAGRQEMPSSSAFPLESEPTLSEEEEAEPEEERDLVGEDSCLEEIWPKRFGGCYGDLRLLEKVAGLFNRFLGVKGARRMGATGFRMFSRKCKLCSNGLKMAGIDIMYIDITRRWNLDNPEGTSAGMCFGAFLEAFFALAHRKFRGGSSFERVSALVEVCERNLSEVDGGQYRRTGVARPRRLRRPEMGQRRVGRPAALGGD